MDLWCYSDTYAYLDHVRRGFGPLIITCGVNGGVHGKEANPALPETPEEIAQEAKRAYDAGASIIAIHMRDPDNLAKNTMRLDVAQETNALVRSVCPDAIIHNTTGGGPGTTMDERSLALDALPEMASLNMGPDMSRFVLKAREAPLGHPHGPIEHDSCVPYTYGIIEGLASGMQSRDVKPEMEIYNPGAYWPVMELIRRELIKPPYVHQFVMGYQSSPWATPQNLLDLVRDLPRDSIFFSCGIGVHQVPMTTMAILLGGHIRVGLEDNVYLKRGKLLSGNAEAVERAVRIAGEFGRPIASPAEARQLLGMSAEPRAYSSVSAHESQSESSE